jgi:NAD(P)-dependent dehydrogenase (short-subunit alcohol dehydrogenase family)
MLYSYSLAKCALNMMTRLCAHEFKSDGVLCMAVHPGWVSTDMGMRAGAEMGGTGDYTVDQATLHMVEIMTRATEEHTGLYLAKDMERLPF